MNPQMFLPILSKEKISLTEATYGMKKRLRAGKRLLSN